MHKLIWSIGGIAITYAFGALCAWGVNPGEWHILWRFWCLGWAVVWAIGGLAIGAAIDDDRDLRIRRRPLK